MQLDDGDVEVVLAALVVYRRLVSSAAWRDDATAEVAESMVTLDRIDAMLDRLSGSASQGPGGGSPR